MSALKKRDDHSMDDSLYSARRYPEEAYESVDDVTEQAVKRMREKAAPRINSEEWVKIDGFGIGRS
ncbi:hypothetical protein [Phyllobacterium sp. K27]